MGSGLRYNIHNCVYQYEGNEERHRKRNENKQWYHCRDWQSYKILFVYCVKERKLEKTQNCVWNMYWVIFVKKWQEERNRKERRRKIRKKHHSTLVCRLPQKSGSCGTSSNLGRGENIFNLYLLFQVIIHFIFLSFQICNQLSVIWHNPLNWRKRMYLLANWRCDMVATRLTIAYWLLHICNI